MHQFSCILSEIIVPIQMCSFCIQLSVDSTQTIQQEEEPIPLEVPQNVDGKGEGVAKQAVEPLRNDLPKKSWLVLIYVRC